MVVIRVVEELWRASGGWVVFGQAFVWLFGAQTQVKCQGFSRDSWEFGRVSQQTEDFSIAFLLTDGPQYDALVHVPCIKNSAPELKDVIVLTLSFHTEAGREKNPPFVPLQHRLSLAKAA